jgi:trk system potassium uptake protein TrkA
MKIVVIGAGEVGFHISQRFSEEGHDVIVLDTDPDKIRRVQETVDAMAVVGNGATIPTLKKAGVSGAGLLVAVTNLDEVNMVACMSGKELGVKKRVARVKNEQYYEDDTDFVQLAREMGIDLLINPEREAVREAKKILYRAAATDVYDFSDEKVQLVGLRVGKEAPIAGKTLIEAEKEYGGRFALVVAIIRNGTSVIPSGNDRVLDGDHVFVMGKTANIPRVLAYLGAKESEIRNVMIMGGGQIGRGLSRELTEEGVAVKLLEADKHRSEAAAEALDRVLVLYGDGTDVDLLKSENVGDMDGFVAVSNDEENNLMAALLARHYGAKKTIALIKRPNYVPLVPHLGVSAAISPRISTASAILRYFRRGEVLSVATLKENGAEILELVAVADSEIVNRPLGKVKFPRDALVGAVIKNEQVIIPRGETEILPNDRVVVFGLPNAIPQVERMFE